jgi:hypothetical protein
MKPLGGAATAVADAILRIAKDAAPGLAIVSGAIRDLAKRFDNFIKSKDKDGSLTKTITDSIKAAGDLIGALVHLGRSIGGLFTDIGKGSTKSFTGAIEGIAAAVDRFNKAGGGKQIHDFLVTTGQAIATYFTSGEFQKTIQSLQEFFANIKDITASLKSLNDSLSGASGGTISIGGVFSRATEEVTGAFDQINFIIGLFKAIPGVLSTVWGAVSSVTSTVWGALPGFFSTAWATISSTVSSATTAIIGTITTAWGAVAGFFSSLWASISAAVATGWAAVVAVVTTAAGGVATAVQAVITVVTGIWSAFWQTSFGQLVLAGVRLVEAILNLGFVIVRGVFLLIAGFVAASVQGIVGAVTRAWNAVTAVTSTVWNAVASFLSGVWARISGVVSSAASAVARFVSAAWNTVTGVTSRAWAAVSGAVSSAWSAISSRVASAAAGVLATVSSRFTQVWQAISNAFKNAYTAVVTQTGNIISTVVGLGSRIVSAVAGFGSILFDAGAKLMDGLVRGITSKIDAVTGAVNGIAQKIKDFFPGSPVKTGPLTSWNNGGAGKKLIDLLIKGLTGSQSQVAAAAASVASTLQKAVDAYLNQKSSLAKKIAADATAVDKARQNYANVVKLHGLTAANAINSARDAVANASAKLAADKSRGASAAAIRRDADLLGQAQARLQAVIKTQGTRTAVAVTNARDALQKAIAKLAGDKTDLAALNKSFGALGDSKVVALVTKITRNYEGVLSKIAAARENLAARLKDAQAKLADAMKIRDDYAQSVRQATVDFANLTRAQAQEGKALTSADVITNLRQKLAAINDFRNNLKALQAEGLSNDALKQLVDAGVEAGGATATALVQGGQAAVNEVNSLTAQIGSAADDLGTSTARQFFQAGVDQAQGLVNGLQAQSAALESQAAQIAQQMVDAIKAVFARASYDYGFHDPLPTTVNGRKAGVQAPPVQVTVNNPVPETASQSTTRIMRNLATLGPAISMPSRA